MPNKQRSNTILDIYSKAKQLQALAEVHQRQQKTVPLALATRIADPAPKSLKESHLIIWESSRSNRKRNIAEMTHESISKKNE